MTDALGNWHIPLPFTPAAHALGLTALPTSYFAALTALVAGYLALITLAKRLYLRHHTELL